MRLLGIDCGLPAIILLKRNRTAAYNALRIYIIAAAHQVPRHINAATKSKTKSSLILDSVNFVPCFWRYLLSIYCTASLTSMKAFFGLMHFDARDSRFRIPDTKIFQMSCPAQLGALDGVCT